MIFKEKELQWSLDQQKYQQEILKIRSEFVRDLLSNDLMMFYFLFLLDCPCLICFNCAFTCFGAVQFNTPIHHHN